MSISHLVASDLEILVSNVIKEVQVLFQMGCTYKRAWYAGKFAIEWYFSPCIDRFQYCRLVISVDGTHPREPYKGVLLIASTWDANTNRPNRGIGSSYIYENMLSKIDTPEQKQSSGFDHVMSEIQDRNVDANIYLVKIDLEKWTLLHDSGHRQGIMTTNIF
ncbi:hypothetical protein M9H77_03564 [Catharanthus roseus]|uniref:Uncharacterized protein n=1 Tax=Catharanthus roseus TaxID=4058 RepID=A0ACC0CBN9_CATRO|nr:hypothetical protein M9H77_03564 [Catharanthus roseus]